MKILVIQQKMIGDVLTSSILFSVLRKNYPDAELHYVINSHTLPVVEGNPDIDKFVLVTPEIDKNTLLFYKFLKKIRKEKYDVVVDVYGKWSSNLITLFSKSEYRISKYKWYSAFIYSHTFKENSTPVSVAGLAIENRLQLLKPIIKGHIEPLRPKIYLTEREIAASKTLLENFNLDISKPIFMISVLGSSIDKTYPLEYMARLLDFIVKSYKADLLFNYMPRQKEAVKQLMQLCTEKTQKHIHFHIFGKNLREFIAITKHCKAVIGNEGGAINIAKALDKPTFAIFSPWINKNAWNMFEDKLTSDSIHLKDVKPELYLGKQNKLVKKEWKAYYEAFKPELITPGLRLFLKTIS